MKKIKVGNDFKLPFFGFKGECIFNKNTGYLFFEDNDIIDRLGLKETDVINLKTEEAVIFFKKDNESDSKFSEFELRVNNQERMIDTLKKEYIWCENGFAPLCISNILVFSLAAKIPL